MTGRRLAAATLLFALLGAGAGLFALLAASAGYGQSAALPTVAVLSIAAAPDINPGPDGVAAPVSVRIYQLAATDGFQNADFFQLYRDDAALLGAALRGREEIVMTPGQTLRMTEEMKPDARYIGILVAFRAIDQARWRAMAAVAPNKTTALQASVSKLSVILSGSR